MTQQRKYVAYLLRMWQEAGSPGGDPLGEPPLWRASLESPHCRELQWFAGPDELFAFLREQLDQAPPGRDAVAGEPISSERGGEVG
jgi:hypothetical protein